LEPQQQSQCNRHGRTKQNCPNSAPPTQNQRRRLFEPWKSNMSHRLLPFKMGEDGNPSVAARDGYAWVTLPFPQNEILARFPAAAAPSFTSGLQFLMPGLQVYFRNTLAVGDGCARTRSAPRKKSILLLAANGISDIVITSCPVGDRCFATP
jgi:hypothetical protein